MFSSWFKRSSKPEKDESKLETTSELKDPSLPARKIHAGFKIGNWTAFVTSADAEGKEDGRRRLFISEGSAEAKEIPLSIRCDFVRRCTDTLLLCGGASGAIVIVDMTAGIEVNQIPDRDLSLRNTCVLSEPSGKQILVCVGASGHFMRLYRCDASGRSLQAIGATVNSRQAVSGICRSALHPLQLCILYGDRGGIKECVPAHPGVNLKPIWDISAELPRTIGSYPSHSDICVVPRPEGGYVLRDRATHSVLVRDEQGRFLAVSEPSLVSAKLGEKFEIAELHILSDSETFIVNFADEKNSNKIGVFKMITMADEKSVTLPRLRCDIYTVSDQVQQLIPDETNHRLIIVTRNGSVKCVNEFRPLVDATNKEAAVHAAIFAAGLNVDSLINLTQEYRRSFTL